MACLPEEPDWWKMASSNMMGRHLVLVMFITTSLHSGTGVPENIICGVTRGPQGKKKKRNNNHLATPWGWEGLEGLGVQCESWRRTLFSLGRPGDWLIFWERLFCRNSGNAHFFWQPLTIICKLEVSPKGLRSLLSSSVPAPPSSQTHYCCGG